jgi:predicted Zn-dependent protease
MRPSRFVAVVAACAVATASVPVQAEKQGGGLPVIRDAEVEQVLRDYSTPILRAAGLGQRNIRVVIINDRGFNAFVIDAKRIFVNAGALMDAQTPNQIIGVLAHETGHISGGHLSKLRAELATAQTAAIITMLLGIGAMAAAATSRNNQVGGNPAVGMIGAQGVIQRSLLAYQRQHEEQADRAGVNFLNTTGQSAKGMYETFKRFADQMLFASSRADPYLMSHPMPTERIAALAEIAKTSPNWEKKDPPELQARHDLMRAKLFGFMERPDTCCGATRRATPALRRAMRGRYRPIAMRICATRSPRWTD